MLLAELKKCPPPYSVTPAEWHETGVVAAADWCKTLNADWHGTVDALLAEVNAAPEQPVMQGPVTGSMEHLWAMPTYATLQSMLTLPADLGTMLLPLPPVRRPAVTAPTDRPGSLTAPETALRVLALFREDTSRWLKRQWHRELPTQGFCLGGAIWHVQGRPMHQSAMYGQEIVDQDALRPVLTAVDEVVIANYADRLGGLSVSGSGGALVRFNDHPHTTLEDVLAVLEKVAAA